VTPQERHRFDRLVEEVLQTLPPDVQDVLDDVPLHVEDHPGPQIVREMELEHRDDLCGLFNGIPLTERSVEHSGMPPPSIVLYREGILAAAVDEDGRTLKKSIRDQIRITILHEIAHYHGIDEDELTDLGYD